MSARIIVIVATTFVFLAPCASAQFIGDALAAAGVAISEQEAVAIVGSVRGASAPATGSSTTSGTAASAKVYEPSTLGTDVGIRPHAQGGTQPASASTTVVTGSSAAGKPGIPPMSQPQVGGSTGFAGAKLQAESVDPAALAAWQSAMKPVGSKLQSLPSTAVAVSAGGKTCQYDKGVFYEKSGSAWVAIAAPVGASVPSKPLGAGTVFAGGKPHIYYFGTFYVYDGGTKAYVVVAPPAGAMVDYLPDTAKKIDWQGAVHYQYAGTYYKPVYRGSSLAFIVAGQA
jgi:hypothetical protein